MSTFDATAYLDTLEIPSITISTKEIKGVILSFDQYMPYYEFFGEFTQFRQQMDEMKPADVAELEDDELQEIVKWGVEYQKHKASFFRAVFPKKLKYHFSLDPVDYILRKPMKFQDEALGRFFSQTAVAHGLPSWK